MLHVHRAERADGLVEALREILAAPLPDPFAAEVVAVPTRGMERWLTQRMADRLGARAGRADGVCANVEFPSPRRMLGDAVATASGIDPEADPWRPEHLVWPLLGLVDECLHEPWLALLAGHLGGADGADETSRARRFSTVRHLAGLFARYALHRPDMVRAWACGEDVGATGEALGDEAAWQAELWRRTRARIDLPDPAERAETACARLHEDPSLAALPERLSIFGLTRLPAGDLRVLEALAAARDVHVFLLHPSPRLWDRVAHATNGAERVVRRADDPTLELARNRLLASWGHDAREMQLVFTGSEHADHHHETAAPAATLLGRLQEGVRADEPPPADPDPLDEADRSVQVHACHGRARQVEVLRDAILHLLAEDKTLEPRDILVMCPDIEAFAPLIHAIFGSGEPIAEAEDDEETPARPAGLPPDLRVRLADRAVRQTNPVLGTVARVLELAGGRVTASDVLDLADREPVRRRLRFDDDDLGRLEEWLATSGIRWGLDAEHRAPYHLHTVGAGTFRAGLDRVLLGVTMTEDGHRLHHGVLPLDDVASQSIGVAGRFAELVARLRAAVDAFADPKPMTEWAHALATAADSLTATSERGAWQRTELQWLLDDLVAEARAGDPDARPELGLPELRALLGERLAGRPTRANFRTGHLTICTLMPMRSVPHRVVCLLGMDDGVFPRTSPRDGDDLMLADPHVGDRDPRTEDRQLLLDALMAATEKLVITFTGNDERTNIEQPPAVPVGELLDVIDRSAPGAREQVLVRHPLQPFDVRNFAPGALVPERPWGFDEVMLDGARALAAPRDGRPPFLPGPLGPPEERLVEVGDLVRFVHHPVKAFLRQRLGISLSDYATRLSDALPVELDHLEQWGVGDRLLTGVLSGEDLDACVEAERVRGTLPPGNLAAPVLDRIRLTVGDLAHEAAAATAPQVDSVDVEIHLSAVVVSGTIGDLHGDTLRSVTYSKLAPKHRLEAWARFLLLTAADPERPFEATTIGRASNDRCTVAVAHLGPLASDPERRASAAREHLEALVGLHLRGLREPLPLVCKTAAAYATAVTDGTDPVAAARREWESDRFAKEDAEAEHELVFGGRLTLEELLEAPPRDDERWDGDEPTRFGQYALRLWGPLLAHERVVER